MKVNTVLLLVLMSLGVACSEEKPRPVLSGTYEGEFYRSRPDADYNIAKVTLTFNGNQYEGSSDIAKYPAICNGTFSIDGNASFENECFWTAEFDWTFILDGEYEISQSNGELTMIREYDGDVKDVYILRRTGNAN